MKNRFVMAMAVFAATTMQSAPAHHGFAVHYDVNSQVRIEGRVHEALMKNPHATIKVLGRESVVAITRDPTRAQVREVQSRLLALTVKC